jgi:hypothetical protein
MFTHRDIIQEAGGARAIAEKLKMRPETVQMWRHRRRIPRTAWPELIEGFPQITLEALKAAELVSA